MTIEHPGRPPIVRDRPLEILRLIAEGETRKAIAKRFSVSEVAIDDAIYQFRQRIGAINTPNAIWLMRDRLGDVALEKPSKP